MKKLLLPWLIGLAAIALIPQRMNAAESLRFNYGILSFSLSIDALELYANEGKINRELGFYTKRLEPKTVRQLRRILRRRFDVQPAWLYHLTRASMITEMLESLGEVVTTHPGGNGFYALRGSLVNAAVEQQGSVTLIDVLRQFPSEEIAIDISKLLKFKQELTALTEYRQAVTEYIYEQGQSQAEPIAEVSYQNLTVPGKINFVRQTIEIESQIASSNSIRNDRSFRAMVYLPQVESAPVVILSHGFGAEPESFNYLGEHLASYGIAAVAVEHIGSDSDYELEFLKGASQDALLPQEFIERPLDVQQVVDELERRYQSDRLFQNLDLNRIGAIGHSLGGYTTLALAGAKINVEGLRQQCPRKKIYLNISLLMQCRAKDLVPQKNLKDPRIKAAIAISPIASNILGEESVSQITIPTAIISGSKDSIAPVVQEQIYPFNWLRMNNKYLVMMTPGDHFSSSDPSSQQSASFTLIEQLVGKRIADDRPFVKAFALAFVKTYIAEEPDYLPYLNAAYARRLSNSKSNFQIVRSLDLKAIRQQHDDILSVILPTLESVN